LRRLRLLEDLGVIARYRAVLNLDALRFSVEVFVNITVEGDGGNSHDRFIQAVCDWPEVIAAFAVTGENQYLLRVVAQTFDDYSDFVMNRLHKAPGVTRVSSNFLTTTLKHEDGLSIDLSRVIRKKAEEDELDR
jgi:Lrp/AsnC family transcriptional regulator, leucine-responsive regulatory protein